jgi:hypothetical protein
MCQGHCLALKDFLCHLLDSLMLLHALLLPKGLFLPFHRRPLTRSVPTEQRAPPSLRGGDLLQVPRPEQPILAVGQAHVYGHVLFSPVSSHDFTHQASALLDPVVFHDPNPHTAPRLFGCHEMGAPFLVMLQATIKLERRSRVCALGHLVPQRTARSAR